ncbi:MAG: type VI secretion system tube protein Hcp [Desulfosarcinaceae bacterium]|nr:type VI secretion system tube protein Hcp [Desulfosarcinaceae bacterium]
MLTKTTTTLGIVLLAIAMALPSLAATSRDGDPGSTEIEVCMGSFGCFEAQTFSFAASRSAATQTSRSRDLARVTIEDIILHKVPNRATVELLRLCANGGDVPEVEIQIRRITPEGFSADFIRYLLTDVMVTQFGMQDRGEALPLEEIRLKFRQMAVSVVDDEREDEFAWDVEAAGRL